MHRLHGQAGYCRFRVAVCRLKAEMTNDSTERTQYLDMAEHWSTLVKTYELAEEISGYLQWHAQRLEPPEVFG